MRLLKKLEQRLRKAWKAGEANLNCHPSYRHRHACASAIQTIKSA